MKRKSKWAVLLGMVVAGFILLIINDLPQKALGMFLPAWHYQKKGSAIGIWSEEIQQDILPIFAYPKEDVIVAHREDYFQLKKIKPVELLTMMEVENLEDVGGMEPAITKEPIMPEPTAEPSYTPVPVSETATPAPEPSAEPIEVMSNAFVPHTLQTIVNMEELSTYETLLKKFYIVDSVAMVGSDLLDAQTLSKADLRISKNTEGPQILIYHTHSQEGFVDSVKGDDSTTIMGVGEHLAEILRNQYGYQVLHHMGKYDVKTRDNAYSRALPEVKQILEENPSIQVVIDLHRDAVANEQNKLVMDLDGRPTARFMFFNGVSCTRNTGNIDYLKNPNLSENLAFSFQMKKAAEEYYPGLTRKNYIHGYRYNMHLCPRTTLIELGAQNNTLEEAMNACDPIAHILDMVLSGA